MEYKTKKSTICEITPNYGVLPLQTDKGHISLIVYYNVLVYRL